MTPEDTEKARALIRHLSSVANTIRSIREILSHPVFHQNVEGFIRESVFTRLIILMRDLMEKCTDEGHKVSFIEDIVMDPAYPTHVGNIYSAITNMRDAVCHLHIKRDATDGNSFSFLMVFGKVQIGAGLETSYADDVAFFYGLQRLYLRRNIVRAFKDAEAFLVSKQPWIRHRLEDARPIMPAYDYP